ncbi:uncharacterized protein LOC8262761 [Ricinus communis]|uniref:Transmembrane protein n=1 Tax=Ricinus communis TaxID=3988 RepID=B9S565_RICCO|nr:uncharacterized protein LOC8262761 [Ricinus communis]EEF41285.1 conserved hypothetical protein [Ricinus communis]|eukprot:XP_002521134.1 uncharacterized protein LOC8262761 [Ricinus communis]
MASLGIVDSLSSASTLCHSHKRKTLILLSNPKFLPSASFLKSKKLTLVPKLKLVKPISRNSRSFPVIFAVQSNFLKVVQTAWKVGKDGIDAGTRLVPDSVPRPIARISVTIVALSVSLFVLKSVLSTAFFALATMGFVYFVFIALNKDQRPKGGGTGSTTSSEDPLEEARRIMEKYK